mmetsp:Transcript_12898/g.25823  ORF Transcript_12898/g.25823 Transcript_12898/m.25823 type:complete len:264 (+) Transcript_12898:2483-3274(+)
MAQGLEFDFTLSPFGPCNSNKPCVRDHRHGHYRRRISGLWRDDILKELRCGNQLSFHLGSTIRVVGNHRLRQFIKNTVDSNTRWRFSYFRVRHEGRNGCLVLVVWAIAIGCTIGMGSVRLLFSLGKKIEFQFVEFPHALLVVIGFQEKRSSQGNVFNPFYVQQIKRKYVNHQTTAHCSKHSPGLISHPKLVYRSYWNVCSARICCLYINGITFNSRKDTRSGNFKILRRSIIVIVINFIGYVCDGGPDKAHALCFVQRAGSHS